MLFHQEQEEVEEKSYLLYVVIYIVNEMTRCYKSDDMYILPQII